MIKKLKVLRDNGILSEEEYIEEKKKHLKLLEDTKDYVCRLLEIQAE